MSRIYFVAGETSGDNHGAELLRGLRRRDPGLQFFGRGGPNMRALAGEKFRDWVEDAAVVGLWEVFKHYRFFWREFRRTINEIAALQPDAVVLIDYPGFNLRLARALRRKHASLRIIYYISPQVWAWNQRRVNSMARSIDLMLCIFPFEPRFYERAGLRAMFVGHPMVIRSDPPAAGQAEEGECPREPELDKKTDRSDHDDNNRDRRLVALFPGSRSREVKKILPVMLAAARELLRVHPDLRFEIAAASASLKREIESMVRGADRFTVSSGEAGRLMIRANAAMIASGTATLEAALARLPFVLAYRVAWPTYFAARMVVNVQWLGMPNVLAKREIVPEFIQHKARPRAIAQAVARLLEDSRARGAMLAAFASVSQELSAGEAGANAADAIFTELSSRASHGQVATGQASA